MRVILEYPWLSFYGEIVLRIAVLSQHDIKMIINAALLTTSCCPPYLSCDIPIIFGIS